MQARKLTYLVGGPVDSIWTAMAPALLATDTTTDQDEALHADYVLVNLTRATWEADTQARAALMLGIPVYAFGTVTPGMYWWLPLCQHCASLQDAVGAINAAVAQERGREAA